MFFGQGAPTDAQELIEEGDLVIVERVAGNIVSLKDKDGVSLNAADTVDNISDLFQLNPLSFPDHAIRVRNYGVGGSIWVGGGTRWRAAAHEILVGAAYNITTPSDADEPFLIVALPAAPDWLGSSRSVYAQGDLLRLSSFIRKGDSTRVCTRHWRFGTNSNGVGNSDIEIPVGSAHNSRGEPNHYFSRSAESKVRKEGVPGSTSLVGPSDSTSGGELTLGASIDLATHYFSLSAEMSGGTANSNLPTAQFALLYHITCGGA